MTHTLHRRGNLRSLSRDYVFLCMAAKRINEDGADDKMRQFLRICLSNKAINIGDMRTGNLYSSTPDEIMGKVTTTSIVQSVFTDIATVQNVMKELKEANLGMSVVISGPFRSTKEALKKAGLIAHSADYSAGIWGNTKKLPPNEVLEVCTMCGHGMVSPNLLKRLVEPIKKGEITVEEAARELSKQCACGIFNPSRAVEILSAMASK
jgi:hypothetical protein